MKRGIRESVAVSAALLAVLFILPLLVIVPFRSELLTREPPVDETEGEPFASGDLDSRTVLKVKSGDTVEEMDLGTYLVGVVRAEMPASFEEEAKVEGTVLAVFFGGRPDLYLVQATDRRQPRRGGGHLYGLHLLPGLHQRGAGPGQLGEGR